MGIRTAPALIRFSAGQISRKLRQAFDLPVFNSACEKMVNFIATLQGPARFREGTRFVRETDEHSNLVPFKFSKSQSYMLEFTHRRMRVYKDGALLMGSTVGPITDAAQDSSGGNFYTVIELTGHGFSDFDEVLIEGVNGALNVNGMHVIEVDDANNFRINGKPGGTFASSPNSTARLIAGCSTPYRAYDDGDPDVDAPPDGVLTFDKTTLDASFGLFDYPEFLEFDYAQAFDTMYIVHENCEPRKIVRASDLSWSCATYSRTADPFDDAAEYPAAITFYENRLVYGGQRDTPQHVFGTKSNDFADHTVGTGATDAFKYAASVSDLSAIRTLIGNEDFLTVGCADGSARMSGGGTDVAITPTSVQIKSLDSVGVARVRPCLVGTAPVMVQRDRTKILGIQYNVEAGRFRPEDLTKFCDDILLPGVWQMAYQVGEPNVLWSRLQNGILAGLTYSPSDNVLAWHTHETRPGDKFKVVAVAPNTDGVDQTWVIAERQVAGETKYFIEIMDTQRTYPQRDDYFTDTTAAHKVTDTAQFQTDLYEAQKLAYHLDCGLTYDGSDTDRRIELAALTGSNVLVTASAAYFAAGDVGRFIYQKGGPGRGEIITFSSTTEVRILITEAFDIDADSEGDFFLENGDWYITATTLTGLDHLEGEEVWVWADGGYHPPRTVENGEISLQAPVTVAHAGLRYIGMIKTTNIESGGMNGPAQSKRRNIQRLVCKFLDTLGAKFGTDPYNLSEVPFRFADSQLGRPPLLYSGNTRELPVNDTASSEKHLYIVQDVPGPCTVAMATPIMETET